MPARDTEGTGQSNLTNRENDKPHSSPTEQDQNPSSQKDDEDFVDVSSEDVDIDMPDSEHDKPASDDLGLQRYGVNLADPDEDDDSEEEQDRMANHPLLSMLTGRLGQRRRGSSHRWDHLHPVTQVLSLADVDECTELEEENFPEEERCTREKVSSFRVALAIQLPVSQLLDGNR